MSDFVPAQSPLAIDRVERARGDGDHVRLRLTGRWLTSGDLAELDALLVVQSHGRRNRFPADSERRKPGKRGDGGTWKATFQIPDWAVPRQYGQASLWVGSAVVPVPPPGSPPVAVREPPVDQPRDLDDPDDRPRAPEPLPRDGGGDAGRAGPLADLLFKETVSALHAELEARSAEAARLRGELARARSEIESRSGAATGLQSAHGELREEMRRLMEAAARQRSEHEARQAELRDEAATARADRDGARAELEQARAALGSEQADHARTRAAAEQELDAARSALERELVEAQAGHERELAAARSALDRDLDATRARADADVGALRDRVAELLDSEQRRGDESGHLREQLAAAHVARDAALSETAGLRAELEQLGSQLAVTLERGAAPGDELSEAQQLLADARALTEQLRGESGG